VTGGNEEWLTAVPGSQMCDKQGKLYTNWAAGIGSKPVDRQKRKHRISRDTLLESSRANIRHTIR